MIQEVKVMPSLVTNNECIGDTNTFFQTVDAQNVARAIWICCGEG